MSVMLESEFDIDRRGLAKGLATSSYTRALLAR